MKKVIMSGVSTLLVLSMLMVLLMSPAAALMSYNMTQEQWDQYFTDYSAKGDAVYMAPGSNPGEMNFAWLGSSECSDPTVLIYAAGSPDAGTGFVGTSVISESGFVSYHVTVTGLEPSTVYEYKCVANGTETDIGRFTTASEEEFSAVFVSDIHVSESTEDPGSLSSSAYNLNSIFAQAMNKNSDISLILSAGDQADHGLLSEYKGVFASPVLKSIPMATACGNHDYKQTDYAYVTNNPNIYNKSQAISPDRNGGDYWFVKDDVLFLYINSNWISAGDHRDFVEQAVNANPDVKWRVVVMHHDLYGGHIEHREQENELLRTMFVPIFDEFKVDLVLTGHSHVYSRTHVLYGGDIVTDLSSTDSVTDAGGTIYLTTGSTSRPRGEVDGSNPEVAYDRISSEDRIYNIIDFTNDSITVKSFASGSDDPFETFTIEKTTNEGGHPADAANPLYDVVGTVGTIANIFVNLAYIFQKLFESIGITF